MSSGEQVTSTSENGIARVTIDHPPLNILTRELAGELRATFRSLAADQTLRVMVLDAAGKHFSAGADVGEHLPPAWKAMVPEFLDTIAALRAFPVPIVAAVRGRCLGGGFELALACDLVFAGTTAMLGVPEITLGVFPPAAAALLPLRVGASRAASAVLTGRTAPVEAWTAAGLIEVTAPPQELGAAVDHWFEAHLAPRSSAALRFAALASRATLRRQVSMVLPDLERLYLDALMHTHDAIEGIEAFLEKRAPVWSNA